MIDEWRRVQRQRGIVGEVLEKMNKKNKAREGEWEQEMIKKERPKQVKRREENRPS